MLTATPLWLSLLACLRCFGVEDLQHKGGFNGAQQGCSEMPALQMPVYWIFLETFQFLSVPFSPFLSDATHTQRCQFKGQIVIFLLCVKKPTKQKTHTQTNNKRKKQIKPKIHRLPLFSGFEENTLFCNSLPLAASADFEARRRRKKSSKLWLTSSW